MKIAVVAKDPGGASNILPVLRELRLRGLNSVTAQLMTNIDSWLYKNRPAGENLLGVGTAAPEHYVSDILVTSMCSNMPDGRNLGRDIAMATPRGKVVVAVTDTWDGTQVQTAVWAQRECRPDYIIVNDKIGAEMVLEANPWLGPDCVKQLGWPALDQYAGVNIPALRATTRGKLGIGANKRVVLYCGQIPYTGEGLQKLVVVLITQSQVLLIARKHPRLGSTPDSMAELERWNMALESFDRQSFGHTVDSSDDLKPEEAIAACNLAVGLNGSMLRDAAIMGKDVICIRDHIPPEHKTRFPLIELGCAVEPASQAELNEAVQQALTTGLDLAKRQAEVFQLDGQNTKRVTDFITTLL